MTNKYNRKHLYGVTQSKVKANQNLPTVSLSYPWSGLSNVMWVWKEEKNIFTFQIE